MTDLRNLVPQGEEVWVTYSGKKDLLFFLTGPAGQSSTLTAQKGEFSLYAVTGGKKIKKLGSGGNPSELETKFKVAEAISASSAKKAS